MGEYEDISLKQWETMLTPFFIKKACEFFNSNLDCIRLKVDKYNIEWEINDLKKQFKQYLIMLLKNVRFNEHYYGNSLDESVKMMEEEE